MPELSIIIVNFNTGRLCAQTIEAVLQNTKELGYEIIVVDNSTNPAEVYPVQQENVKVYSGLENKGFGQACNYGARQARGKYLLFLNPDTIVGQEAINKSLGYMKTHPDIGALGIKTYLPDGTFDHGCKRGFPTPLNSLYYFLGLDKMFPHNPQYGGYRLTYLSEHETNEVDSVSGAFLMMPRSLFEDLGGFDEDFFMHGEDLDLCYRIKQAGFRIIYYAEAQMIHLKGQSALNTGHKAVLRHLYYSMELFYDKHYHKRYNLLVSWLVHTAIHFKLNIALLNASERRQA